MIVDLALCQNIWIMDILLGTQIYTLITHPSPPPLPPNFTLDLFKIDVPLYFISINHLKGSKKSGAIMGEEWQTIIYPPIFSKVCPNNWFIKNVDLFYHIYTLKRHTLPAQLFGGVLPRLRKLLKEIVVCIMLTPCFTFKGKTL